jgi:hypothetical protein
MLRSIKALCLAAAALALPNLMATSARSQTMDIRIGGVIVRADGVLEVKFYDAALNARRIDAALATLDKDVAHESELRKVSLTRLEKALADRLAAGQRPTAEMLALAGLTRVTHAFVYPETGDVVIAGPAGAWAEDVSGRVRHIKSGRPVVELQDLVVALRAFPPTGEEGPVIGCSIDATQEGLAAMQDFLASVGGTISPNTDTTPILVGLKNSLGLQVVSVLGVSPNTHFAQVLVEADYRMKLMGIGLERVPVKMKSWVERASGGAIARNAMQRWYFTPDYQCVRVSDDEQAMELVGEGVKLVGADEVVAADGSRSTAASVDRSSREWTRDFTKNYARIAEASPVYAQLRNLIDLSIVAAFLQQQDYYGLAGWKMEVFADEQQFPVETYQAPVNVDSAVNGLWKGSRFLMPIGGGVHIEPWQALELENRLEDEEGAVGQVRSGITLDQLQDGQWWWD